MDEPVKPYTLTFEQRPGYLYARVDAETMTPEAALSYLNEIADKCAALNCDRLIVERNVRDLLSTAALFFIGEEMAEIMRGLRVAFVNPNATHEQALGFGVMVGTNRGGEFEMHPTISAAERWLLQ